MSYLAWWAGGLLLSGVALVHWALVRRMMAVSGRITVLINRLRYGDQSAEVMSEPELMAALLVATQAEFGVSVPVDHVVPTVAAVSNSSTPQSVTTQITFFVSLAVGSLIAAIFSGKSIDPVMTLRSHTFATMFGSGSFLVLIVGGMLVGFGTRMAGGCTSGHGLCGVSRFQPGSFLATAAFFGTGIALSFALEALL